MATFSLAVVEKSSAEKTSAPLCETKKMLYGGITIFSSSRQVQLLLTRCDQAFQQDEIVLAHALNRGG